MYFTKATGEIYKKMHKTADLLEKIIVWTQINGKYHSTLI